MHLAIRFHHIVSLLLIMTLLVSCATNPVTGRQELSLVKVSTEQEVELGRKTFPVAIQQSGGRYPDEALQDYVNAIGKRLAQGCERPDLPFQFAVVNDSTPNAFALPGGQIAITRGLLVNLTNEEQLAAVLGHEIGHVTARHAVQGINRGVLLDLGMTVLASAGADGDYAALSLQAGQLTATLLDRTYSRTQEADADRLGINYMVIAGYDPQGAVELQEFFSREVEGWRSGNQLEKLFRTHPFSSDRLKQNRAYLASLPSATITDKAHRTTNFRRATTRLRDTREAYARHDKAVALERQGHPRDAIVLYLKAVTTAPNEALLRHSLGMAQLRAGDRIAAKRQLRQAVLLDENDYQSRLGLGYLYQLEANYRRALLHLRAAQKLLPTTRGAYLLAETFEKTGQPAAALGYYRQVAAQEPQTTLGQAAAARIAQLTESHGAAQ
ncbi:MAG: M48 family metalloprotease [Desulfuromonadales bacterium]|nr:M48 family metalloprotease [Desulfuromonadales bacterium]